MSKIRSKVEPGESFFKQAREVKSKRRGLRRMSKKRQAESKIYLEKRRKFLEEHPVCEFKGCNLCSVDVHHSALRGKNYLNEETWIAVCRNDHDWIHAHPNKARKLGLLA